MDIIKLLQKIIIETINAGKPCDLRYATVNSLSPLTITLEAVQLVITAPAVTMMETLKELAIDDFAHKHSYKDDNGEEEIDKETGEALTEIQCYLGGVGLGKNSQGKIIIRKGIAVGDKVVVIRANGGQEYLIIGRV